MKKVSGKLILFAGLVAVASCSKERSPVTAWEYNNPKNGGFEVVPYSEQETGPGLVLVEGGTFTMGRAEQDVTYDWNAIPRRVTVSSFYIDQTEVRNLDYLEYLHWTERVFSANFYDVVKKAYPDSLVWRDRLAYNEPYVEYYLRHPAYRDYPVVGVNWLQASDFCAWRTDRVNEFILSPASSRPAASMGPGLGLRPNRDDKNLG
ncbi:MAG TPA: SUMF1/EgtB/PvdO family nonheme iron enzyme [Bacteroidia bacterium]|nr:SUMF1/EgtB/PvdO family nonheme iron enzyme [Bacteroidia bacterium]